MIHAFKQTIRIDTSQKDVDLTTNPCSSDRNCVSKGALGKFFRKQDFGKIQRKKKPDQQSSLLCYLTPKNCEDTTKIIKQKFRQNTSELSINNFLSRSSNNVNEKQQQNKFTVNKSLIDPPSNRITSIQKDHKQADKKLKISFKDNSSKNDPQDSFTSRNTISKLKGTGSFRNFKLNEIKREEEQNNLLNTIPSSQSFSTNFDKQLKKLKNQCQHYSKLLQTSNKQKADLGSQIKSLNLLVQELKQKNTNLMVSQSDLQKEILKLTEQYSFQKNQNQILKQKLNKINDEKSKYEEEIAYLKSNITDLNERIDFMLQNAPSSTPQKSKNLKSSMTFSNQKETCYNKRINSMCYVNRSDEQNSQQEMKSMIHDLQQQLKYAQVQVNMLKRVKMDINKKNEQFIKLQRQNQILKNQIFDMKMNDAIQQQGNKTYKNQKSQKVNKSGFYPSIVSRNNFQLSLQRGNRSRDANKLRDFDNKSESSDTLSLNLSVSPEKERFRS